jgi:hypothetical protein
MGLFECHFVFGGEQAIDDGELAWAGKSALELFLGGQGVVVVFIHQKNGIEKIIFYKKIEMDRFASKLRKNF